MDTRAKTSPRRPNASIGSLQVGLNDISSSHFAATAVLADFAPSGSWFAGWAVHLGESKMSHPPDDRQSLRFSGFAQTAISDSKYGCKSRTA
jgi:hypothetical protein